jgi:hypothetical protein
LKKKFVEQHKIHYLIYTVMVNKVLVKSNSSIIARTYRIGTSTNICKCYYTYDDCLRCHNYKMTNEHGEHDNTKHYRDYENCYECYIRQQRTV